MASLLAIAFVFTRLAYAVVFGGAGGSTTLVNLPQFRLPAPFSHIQIFGPIALEGLYANLLSALPFALAIIGFGVLASFIRPASFLSLANRSGFLKNLLSAIALGWAQLPSLASALRRIEFARRLRGEKRHRMLVPILETTVARALGMATRLARPSGVVTAEGLKVSDFRSSRLGSDLISFSLAPGEIMVIEGPTGSGKSSLLLALSQTAGEMGMDFSGEIITPGRPSLVPQQPRDSLWGPRVEDEVSDPSFSALKGKTRFSVESLSEGEAVLLAIEVAFRQDPKLLLLDEPMAALDEISRRELIEKLAHYQSNGGTVVVAEHRPELYNSLAPRRLTLGLQPPKPAFDFKPMVVGHDLVLDYRRQRIEAGENLLLEKVEIQVHQSELIAIEGPNGSGKTTLLKTIASIAKAREIAMVPELASDFFVTTSLEDELTRADRLAKVSAGFTKDTMASIIPVLPSNLSTHPRDLSAGTQLALAIAMQLSYKPKVLLLDEPVKGFDPVARELISHTLKCVQETGCAILLATHDKDFIAGLNATRLEISNRRLSPVQEVLS